jgi:hypothetical protein
MAYYPLKDKIEVSILNFISLVCTSLPGTDFTLETIRSISSLFSRVCIFVHNSQPFIRILQSYRNHSLGMQEQIT